MARYTENKKMSNRKWDASNLDRMSIAAPKGTRERWKNAALARDTSLNQLIYDSVERAIVEVAESTANGNNEE